MLAAREPAKRVSPLFAFGRWESIPFDRSSWGTCSEVGPESTLCLAPLVEAQNDIVEPLRLIRAAAAVVRRASCALACLSPAEFAHGIAR